MFFELLGREREALVRDLTGSFFMRVIEGIDNQFSVNRNGFLFGVIEVDSSPETARRRLARLRVHRGGPDHHDLRRLLKNGLFVLSISDPRKFPREIRKRRFAAARGQEQRCHY